MSILGALGGVGKGVMIGAEEVRKQKEDSRKQEKANQEKSDRDIQKASDAAYVDSQRDIGTRSINQKSPNYAAANTVVQDKIAAAPYGNNGVEFDPANAEHARYVADLSTASSAIPQTNAVSKSDAERNYAANPAATAKDSRDATGRAYALDAADAAVVERKTKADITAVQTGVMKLQQARAAGLLSDDDAVKQLQSLSGVIPDGSTLTDGLNEKGARTLTYGKSGTTVAALPRTKESIDQMLQSVLDNSSVETMTAALKRKHENDVLAETVAQRTATNGIAQQNADTQKNYYGSRAESAQIKAGGVAVRATAKDIAGEVKQNAQLYSYTPLNGEKPIEHVAAKSLYSRLIKDPRIGGDQSFAIMQSLHDEAEKESIDQATGAVDPTKFLTSFNGKVQAASARLQSGPTRADPVSGKPVAPAAPAGSTPATPSDSPVERKKVLDARGVRQANAEDRKAEIDKMNTLSGSNRRADIAGARNVDVAKNFDTKLAAIKPGANRADTVATLAWFDANNDSLSNAQRKQVREARAKANL